MADKMADWKIGDPMINERDYWQDPDYVAEDKEKEKLILKLATLITDRYAKKITRKITGKTTKKTTKNKPARIEKVASNCVWTLKISSICIRFCQSELIIWSRPTL